MIKFLGLNNAFKYGDKPSSYDLLKFIAILSMIVDHLGSYFYSDVEIFRAIGRLAFPLFLFLVGYSNNFKTQYSLLFAGIVIEFFQHYYFTASFSYTLDILIAIFLVRIAFNWLDKINYFNEQRFFELYVFSFLFSLPFNYVIEYGFFNFIFAYLGFACRRNYSGYKLHLFIFILLNYLFQKFLSFNNSSLGFDIEFLAISYILFYLTNDFKIIEGFKTLPKLLNKSYLFISRNSLFIYYSHKILFILIVVYFVQGRFEEFINIGF